MEDAYQRLEIGPEPFYDRVRGAACPSFTIEAFTQILLQSLGLPLRLRLDPRSDKNRIFVH
jgi:hypothetical protein